MDKLKLKETNSKTAAIRRTFPLLKTVGKTTISDAVADKNRLPAGDMIMNAVAERIPANQTNDFAVTGFKCLMVD